MADERSLTRRWLGRLLWLVAVLSLTATITEARCTDNPREFCRFNDNIPLMATVVFVYAALVIGRAVMVYLYRPLTSGGLFEDRAVVDERA